MLQFLHLARNSCFAIMVIILFSMCRKTTGSAYIPPPPEPDSYFMLPARIQVNDVFRGYYMALPPNYFDVPDSFPLLVFLHGLGQMGDGNTQLYYIVNDGIGKLIRNKKFPLSFTSNGQTSSFIVVSPQTNREATPEQVMEFVHYIQSAYRTDTSRTYLSGLSLGARVVTVTAAAYPESFAAIVPIAGVATGEQVEEQCSRIAGANLPVWEFHNADDPMSPLSSAENFMNTLMSFEQLVYPKFTVFDKYGHDAWTTALDPLYKEDGMNIYEWMLQFKR